MSYAELLRDPQWQRKRLEIMSRADFACEECGDKTKTLNVHHLKYKRGRKPWEYEDTELRCLCEDCHKREHGLLPPLPKPVTFTLNGGPLEGQSVTTTETFPILWVYRLGDGSLFTVPDAWRVVEHMGKQIASYFPKGGHPITGDYNRERSRISHDAWQAEPFPVLLGMYGWEMAGKYPYEHDALAWSNPDILLLRLTDLWYSLDAAEFDEERDIWTDPDSYWDSERAT